MKEIPVSQEQLSALHNLSEECSRNVVFDESKWLEGVKKILGFLPNGKDHVLVVKPDQAVNFVDLKIVVDEENESPCDPNKRKKAKWE